MPPIIAAAIAYVLPASTAIAFSTLTYATVAANILFTAALVGAQYALALANKPKPHPVARAIKQSDTPRFYVCGRHRPAVLYIFHEALVGSLYGFGVIFNCGRTDAVEEVLIDDRPLTWTGPSGGALTHYEVGSIPARFNMHTDLSLGGPAGYAASRLVTYFPTLWSAAHLARGLSAFYGVMGKPDPKIVSVALPNAFPIPSLVLRGGLFYDVRNPAHDPDDDFADPATWEWSQNPFVIAAHYLRHPDGPLREPYDQIDWDSVAAAADACDALVPAKGAAFEPFARANTIWTTAEEARDVLARLMACCDGWYSEGPDGRWVFGVDAWVAPQVTLTASDISAFEEEFGTGRLAAINRLTVKYTNPAKGYQSDDSFKVEDAASIAAIGPKDSTLVLDACQSKTQAYRMGLRTMRKSLDRRTLHLSCGPRGLLAWGERFITLAAPEIGLAGDWRVKQVSGSLRGGFSLTLEEAYASDYDPIAIPTDITRAPPQLVRTPVTVPTGLAVTYRVAGSDYYLRASVTAPVDETIEAVEFEWMADPGGDWTPFIVPTGLWSQESQALAAGDYLVHARFINVSGVPSEWTSSAAITVP